MADLLDLVCGNIQMCVYKHGPTVLSHHCSMCVCVFVHSNRVKI